MENEILKTGFFEEDAGQKSMMRLMCFVALLAAVLLSFFAALTSQVEANMIALVTMFLVAAFAPKAIQKYAEK